MDAKDLELRLCKLEDSEAVRALKARYFASCDGKSPDGMRACFMDGPVQIDYGQVGRFDRADELVDLFRRLGCHEHIVEMHHGVNAQIEVLGPDHAKAHWGLHYQLINTQDHTLTQLGGYYDDEYRKTRDGWKISATRFVVTSTLVLQLGEVAVTKVFAGGTPPAPGAEKKVA